MRALAVALVTLLSTIPALAEALPHHDLATCCRSILAIMVLAQQWRQKYERCLAYQQSYLRNLEQEWGSLSGREQRLCVTQEAPNRVSAGHRRRLGRPARDTLVKPREIVDSVQLK